MPRPYDAETDITADVHGIQLMTDTGLDEINNCKIEFKELPAVADRDRFRIVITDDNSNTVTRYFEYAPADQSMEITESKGFGLVYVLNLLGLEYHLGLIHYSNNIIGRSGTWVSNDIIQSYNGSRGTDQPEFVIIENDLPSWIINNFPYGETPVPCRDRLGDLCRSYGAPPSVGGTLDFYTIQYENDTATRVNIRIKSLGARDAGTITAGTLASNEDDRITSFAPPEGNRIIGIFGRDAGSLPTGYAEYAGRELRYLHLPRWDGTVAYPVGAEVRATHTKLSHVYRCIAANTNVAVSNAAFWRELTYAEYLGDIQYSPWTDGRAVLWAAAGYDATDATAWGRAMPDFNVVVKSNDFFRTSVDHVGSVSDIPISVPEPYRGYRVLNTATSQVLMHNGVSFDVLYGINELAAGAVVIDESTGDAYVRGTTGFTVDPQASGRDCSHPYHSIYNAPGAIPDTAGMAENQDSAIEIRYDIPANTIAFGILAADVVSSTADAVADYIRAAFPIVSGESSSETPKNFAINPAFYSAGCSLRLKFPFPPRRHGQANLGELYAPETVDIENATYTSTKARGFNDSTSHDLGKISGIGFFMRIKQTVLGSENLITTANIPVRCALRDVRDNVMVQDFTVSFNDRWESVILPVSGFRPYNALSPKQFHDYFIPPAELEQVDDFEWWNVKDITLTILTGYDDEGRFDITGASAEFLPGLSNIFSRPAEDYVSAFAGRTIRMAVDAVRFVKELVVISEPGTAYSHEKIIREPDVGDHSTALYYVRSEEERVRHPRTSLVFDVLGRLDVKYGDSVTFQNDAVGTHTIAVTRAEHSFLSDGFRTRIYGAVRFR